MNYPIAQRSATLTPACGRHYDSAAAVLADWNDGKDFVMNSVATCAYCSKSDAALLKESGFTHLTFRSDTGRILTNVPIKE